MNMGSVYPERYQQLLNEKADELKQLFREFDPPELEVFSSPEDHYRLRAEFRVWHQDHDIYYVMFERGSNRVPIRIDQCPMVAEPIHDIMFDLLEEIKKIPELGRKLFQIDFLSTLSGEVLVTLLYHRAIDENWYQLARPLKDKFGIDLVGRSRKTKLLLDRDFVIEKMSVGNDTLIYKQVENSFTQPNGRVAEKMLDWAVDVTADHTGDLLELYCGNGNFTIAVAKNFDRVLATEISKTSVNAAQFNIHENGLDNINIIRLSSEEFTQAMNKEREFRRLKDIDLDSYDFSTVLVDPPRSGLDKDTENLVQSYSRILYISCNPNTLKDNLLGLSETHAIERFALFDQFPYTDHKECGVWLVKKDSKG
ncbi:tRNA (uridine(54)-C5)-methyltransferase TrmA [Motiliproteus sp. MSK22-1]|uniref:tRNA (uridine(54)-C5)-methyltransferase TrmA n=1 Tax=Motiliproteus sp. MSK22-1 TaxID=1897630 RepID=UPI000975E6D8|nr:tRNA (uridine(54)-C5)-methyltransferase TrmA [Motiliproteus sp. MSK22-1]OMH25688.1 tRNA (uridine(54)-C5)-methyltransferase TrmA [Motiliproteus sp. MSK22-1]